MISRKETHRLFRKAVKLLKAGMTKKEFADFQLALDSDVHHEFLCDFLTEALVKMCPELFEERTGLVPMTDADIAAKKRAIAARKRANHGN